MTIEEANKLINKYIKLREKKQLSNDLIHITQFNAHEKLCLQKFEFLILMKTAKYKNFANYDDLNQDGREALLKAFNSYKPEKKANIFWWINKYVATRISRSANLHTAIRFPLKIAKATPPRREAHLPLLIDGGHQPDQLAEHQELWGSVKKSFHKLSPIQRKITRMVFGVDGEHAYSINKVCKKLKISRPMCLKMLDQVLDILKRNIKL